MPSLPSHNVARYLAGCAQDSPQRPALRAALRHKNADPIPYRELSFGELDHWSAAAANTFREAGIQRGDRVLLMVRPGLELIASVFALFRMGAPPVVIDPGMGLRRFLKCVERSQPHALVGIPLACALRPLFRRAFARTEAVVTVGPAFSQRLQASGAEACTTVPTGADELAAILFTSGSTGPPKGVCYTHGMFEAQVNMIRQAYAIEPGEVDLPMLPVFALFNPALGMTTVVPEMNPSRPAQADPARLVRAIEQNGVTNSFGSPVLWSKVVTYCESRGLQLPSLRRVLMAGAPASPELIRRLKSLMPNGEIHTPYGATEVLPVSSISGSEILQETAELSQRGRGTCVGRPLPGVDVRIIGVTDGTLPSLCEAPPCAIGQPGEIVATGPSVTREYDRLPEATAKAKCTDEAGRTWHRMGDLGYFDAQGRLWFCGRMAERVETPDGLLYTDCIEGIFNQHPGVFRTALVGLGERPRQRAVLAVEPLAGAWPRSRRERAKFVEALRQLGEGHPDCRRIIDYRFVKHFPVDVRHNAKIHRLKLRQRFSSSD